MKIFNPDRQSYQLSRSGTVFVRLERGVLRATGNDRLDLLHRLSTNATRDLKPGGEASTILTSDKGRIVEVVRVLAFDEHVLLLLHGTDTARTLAFLDRYTIMDDFTPADVSERYVVVGLYGSGARSIVAALVGMEPENAGAFSRVELDGAEIIAMRDVRLNGAGGFLLLVSSELADSLLAQLRVAGIAEIDGETYNTLRIENGIPASGLEVTEQYNPLEGGLSALINWTKGCYIGQEVIARLDTYDKVQRHLVGLIFDGTIDAADADGHEVILQGDEGKKVGVVTSAAFSPESNRTIALAYVRTLHAIPGTELAVVVDGEQPRTIATATISKLPFDL